MSVRVDYTEVLAILGGEDSTSLDSGQSTAFIEAASEWIDANLEDACTISAGMLAQIEKFLAAHLCTVPDPQLSAASRGDISETYMRTSGAPSEFLAAAAAMDPCGIIKERWMGASRFRAKIGTTYTAEAT